MSSHFRHRPGALAVIAALLLVGGCQKAADNLAETAIERASGEQVAVERYGDTVVVKTDQGQMSVQTGDSLPLPAGFPKDVYLPGDYAVNSVMDLEGIHVLSLNAPGKVSDLFAQARDAMAGNGWKQTMAMQHSTDSAMLAFEKEQRAATLSFNHDGDAGVVVGLQLRGGQAQQ